MRKIAFILCLLASGSAAETTLFDWSQDACARWDIPDTPARFWREETGVAMIAGSESSRISRGPSPFALERVLRTSPMRAATMRTRAIMTTGPGSIRSGRIGTAGSRPWPMWSITGTGMAPARAGTYMACWRNSIIALESRDGRSFVRSLGPPVAALPEVYDSAQTRRSGYFNPSNIFSDGRFLHVFVFAEAYGAQARGACLLRRRVEGGDVAGLGRGGFRRHNSRGLAGPSAATPARRSQG